MTSRKSRGGSRASSRLHTSFLVSCPFCIDLNARDFEKTGLSEEEIAALQGKTSMDQVATLEEDEKAALRYVQCICATPLSFPSHVIDAVKKHFTERGIVIIASTCAQVNFWARLIQSLGVPPAGFSAECSILNLDSYTAGTDTQPSGIPRSCEVLCGSRRGARP